MTISSTLSSATTSSAVTTPCEDPYKQPNGVTAEMELFIRLHEYACNPSIHFPNPYVDQSKLLQEQNRLDDALLQSSADSASLVPYSTSSASMTTRSSERQNGQHPSDIPFGSSNFAQDVSSSFDGIDYHLPRTGQGSAHEGFYGDNSLQSIPFPRDSSFVDSALRLAGKQRLKKNGRRLDLMETKLEPLDPSHSFPQSRLPNDLDSHDSSLHSHLFPRRRSQVKVACIHCKKACKKCDEMRPCRRCIRLGLKDCIDAPRKERRKTFKKSPYERYEDVTAQFLDSSLEIDYGAGAMYSSHLSGQVEQDLQHPYEHPLQHLDHNPHLEHLDPDAHQDLMAHVSSAFYDTPVGYPPQ